ncbi:MAG: zf-TFIIB domain-containing protein [bacterium]
MKCPHCNVNLVMSEKQGVEIDYCPECRGIWLDRGELEKIIERSTQSYAEPQRSPAYSNDHHYEKQYKQGHNEHSYGHHGDQKHRKKSFLEDIFDFG